MPTPSAASLAADCERGASMRRSITSSSTPRPPTDRLSCSSGVPGSKPGSKSSAAGPPSSISSPGVRTNTAASSSSAELASSGSPPPPSPSASPPTSASTVSTAARPEIDTTGESSAISSTTHGPSRAALRHCARPPYVVRGCSASASVSRCITRTGRRPRLSSQRLSLQAPLRERCIKTVPTGWMRSGNCPPSGIAMTVIWQCSSSMHCQYQLLGAEAHHACGSAVSALSSMLHLVNSKSEHHEPSAKLSRPGSVTFALFSMAEATTALRAASARGAKRA
mmetsp:Transcript_31270/g.72755  ORF Transcript_31270/g.72755 Transcript_31270/m.72755 type:complete len:281 (+) Transcript_31270:4395-5237(+)